MRGQLGRRYVQTGGPMQAGKETAAFGRERTCKGVSLL